MKSKLNMFIIGLFVGVTTTILAIVVILPRYMFVVKESKLGFKETIEVIEKSAAEQKWSMPHQYDLQATMKKHGFDVQPVNVFSLCKPEHAFQILSSDNEKMASALMPCRIAVYEKEGKTFVSMLNSGLFSKFMGTKIKTVMGAAAAENKQILAPVIKN